jgi:hypothetical protein
MNWFYCHITIILFAMLIFFSFATGTFASTASSSLNISVTVPSSSILSLGTTTLRFSPDDPTVQPSVPAQENPVSVIAKTRSKGTPSLTVIASDDLKDGANSIPVTALSWTADAAPYINGTMNKSTAQAAALFAAGSGSYQSAFRYFLANSPLFIPGTYSTTINYTLTAP